MSDHEDTEDGGSLPGQGAEAGDRVAKALARAGVASRREVERYIEAGRVRLNGEVLTAPGVKIGPDDVLTVDGKVVGKAEPTRVWRYHKPVGLMTTHADPQGRPTVFAALPKSMPRVISVGRLDLNSEGLLLLTNDGGLSRALELPASGLLRRYRARARGRITQDQLDRLKDGITVEGVVYGPIDAVLDKAKGDGEAANLWITVTLTEGKNREVRKVLEAIGLTVNRLIRLAYGPFQLGTLALGEVEEVGPRVIREQLAEFITPENLPSGERAPRAVKPDAPPKAPREPAEKTVYKSGWAKPKFKKGTTTPKRKPAQTAGPVRFTPRREPGIHPAETFSARPKADTTRPTRAEKAGAKPAGRRGPAKPFDKGGKPFDKAGKPFDKAGRSFKPRDDKPRAPRPDAPSGNPFDRPDNRAAGRAERPSARPFDRADRPERKTFERREDRLDKPAGKTYARPAGKTSGRAERPERKTFERREERSDRPAGKPYERAAGAGKPADRPKGPAKPYARPAGGAKSFDRPKGAGGKPFARGPGAGKPRRPPPKG